MLRIRKTYTEHFHIGESLKMIENQKLDNPCLTGKAAVLALCRVAL